jgi:pimeloyl-ACP methyl ester carboxylesterase
MRPTYYIPIHGTNAFRIGRTGDWWHAGSPFFEKMKERNLVMYRPEDPFFWSSSLEGIVGGNETWCSAGAALRYYLAPIAYEHRNLIAHSHGGQVAAYCASGRSTTNIFLQPCPIRTLIYVGVPVRKDMEEIYSLAAGKIAKIVSIYDPRDTVRWLGSWFDGSIAPQKLKADIEISTRGISHSKILNEQRYIEKAIESGWFEHLR